ncbi:Uncharacterised protein [Mycobacteroides abscessus subsp. abscessus]|nr:Uncharacterised protein [Mycobacteroides abscessus subsp. abscessus]
MRCTPSTAASTFVAASSLVPDKVITTPTSRAVPGLIESVV